MTRRRLSPEEQALWDQVARKTEPINKPRSPAPTPPPKPPKPQKKPAPKPQVPTDFKIGQGANHRGTHDLLPGLAEQMGRDPLRMDRKTHKKMKRGKLVPDARIDLHGMTQAEAHPALVDFISTSRARGFRLVLVITGKGKDRDDGGPIPTRFGVLKHQVPQWLRMAPLGPLVLQISPASLRHGGEGAYYVYLKRR